MKLVLQFGRAFMVVGGVASMITAHSMREKTWAVVVLLLAVMFLQREMSE